MNSWSLARGEHYCPGSCDSLVGQRAAAQSSCCYSDQRHTGSGSSFTPTALCLQLLKWLGLLLLSMLVCHSDWPPLNRPQLDWGPPVCECSKAEVTLFWCHSRISMLKRACLVLRNHSLVEMMKFKSSAHSDNQQTENLALLPSSPCYRSSACPSIQMPLKTWPSPLQLPIFPSGHLSFSTCNFFFSLCAPV